jgi:hypothetical protein
MGNEAAAELQRQIDAKKASDAKADAERAARPESKIIKAVFLGALALWGWNHLKNTAKG